MKVDKQKVDVLLAGLIFLLPAISFGQTAESKRGAMSIQFKEQARRAFHAIERLDPDGDFQSQPAHRAVNNLIAKIKTPLDRKVQDILFTWLAELEVGRMETKAHPAS